MSENIFIPPQNIDAEKAVLGSVLLDQKSIIELPATLKPESFYLPSHGRIYEAMRELWAREIPIDPVSVAAELKGQNISIAKLTDIADDGMPASIAYHAGLIIAASEQRHSIDIIREGLLAIEQNPERHQEILARLYSASDQAVSSAAVRIKDVLLESLERINSTDKARAIIPTGFNDLDRQIGGIEPGELAVIAGRPSMGKTSIALDLQLNAATRGFAGLFISVETTREKLGMRLLSRETRIDSRRFRISGALDGDDRCRLVEACTKLGRLPIHVLDREADWHNIKREIRRRKRNGLDLVILDYLTLLDLPTGKHDRRDLAVGRIANEAKQLALSLNLAFILLSQLNRKSEDRTNPEPIMSDLRDSGDIEQVADIIIFPFRPVIYDPDYKPHDKAFLKLAKARDLPIGKIPVRFNAQITSFTDWTEIR
jgi:replicative DNA helicase